MTPDRAKVELEARILAALHEAAPRSARELGEALGVRGHDVSKVLNDMLARGLVTAAPHDPAREADHANPRVYTATT